MKKLVYLFELDSVRKTDQEILLGQKALYEELVGNGNTVVLTYNQLVDSRAFFSLLEDARYADSLITLFEQGAIRISQYGDNRSIVQYLINSLSPEREFVYSGWPLKSTQKRLLSLIRRSLQYSDMSELTDYIEGTRSRKELLDLFSEVSGESIKPTKLTADQCTDILSKLYHLLKTILRLSYVHTIYLEPRDKADMSLPKYLYEVSRFRGPECGTLWRQAFDILFSLETDRGDPLVAVSGGVVQGSSDRSKYHLALLAQYHQLLETAPDTDKRPYQYAEAIVDLCYNYQLEYSVRNSSKHYNVSELGSDNPVTFREDFFSRLKRIWEAGDPGEHFLLEETNEFREYGRTPDGHDTVNRKRIVRGLARAARMLAYYGSGGRRGSEEPDERIRRYEYGIAGQRRRQRIGLLAAIGRHLLFMLISIGIACGLQLGTELLQDYTEAALPWNFVTATLTFLAATELVTWALTRVFRGFMSFSEAVGRFARLFMDLILTCTHRVSTYLSRCTADVQLTEPFRKGAHIEYIVPGFLKKYISLQREKLRLFDSATGQLRIEDLTERNPECSRAIREIIRLEELFDNPYGVVYQSKFNTLVVDPIISEPAKDGKEVPPYRAYERVLPSGADGTVLVTRHHGNYVLLEQYRHAPRKIQYSFPRGSNENGLAPLENAEKELKEELRAAGELVFLGRINPDSGLTSSSADVFLVEIEDYSPTNEEGIRAVREFSETRFEQMLREGGSGEVSFDDGFTLAAYALYKAHTGRG